METTITPQDETAQDISAEINVEENSEANTTFKDLFLSENLLKALADMGFEKPSSIQREAIPEVMSGNDIIAKAPTGSGKTAAFAIPIIEKLDLNSDNKVVQALVMCPTRELAIQVHKEFEKLTAYHEEISIVSVYGGQNIEKQLSALRKKPQVIVATPGRLMDHLRRGSISLNMLHTVVLDEADEMLDMGFREDIHTILETTPVNRQTILFSATMAKDIMELTKKFQKSPNIVDVTDNLMNTPNIEQQYFEVVEKNKIELITRLLNLHNVKSALVFCNTKSNVDRVVEVLKTKGYFADAIHGDMNQNQREKVMFGFRKGTVEILVATDVAGRGIDVKDIGAVFNYDMPRDDEDYIHRVGRTGRAGTSGISFTFVTKKQVQSIKRIERANGIQIHKKDVPTFEEIEVARESSYTNKIQAIIETDDLSEYKAKIESMTNETCSIIDVAAAILKMSVEKSAKKINKNVVFEVPEEEKSERRGRSRGRRDDRRFGRRDNRRDDRRDDKRFSSEKKDSFRGKRQDNRGKDDFKKSKDFSFEEEKQPTRSESRKANKAFLLDEMVRASKSFNKKHKGKPSGKTSSRKFY